MDKEDRLIRQTNRQGRLWLHELIISGNARAFELALSPVALGWTTLSSMHWGKLKFENLRDMNGLNLKDTAHLLGGNMMEKIMDMVKDVAVLYKLEIELENRCEELSLDKKDRDSCMGVPDLKALDDFHDDSASSVAERLVRFCRDYGTDEAECWRCRPVTPAGLVALLVDSLYLRGLSWITNDVPSL